MRHPAAVRVAKTRRRVRRGGTVEAVRPGRVRYLGWCQATGKRDGGIVGKAIQYEFCETRLQMLGRDWAAPDVRTGETAVYSRLEMRNPR